MAQILQITQSKTPELFNLLNRVRMVSFLDSASNGVCSGWPLAVVVLSFYWQSISWAQRGGQEIVPLVEGSEDARTPHGPLALPMQPTAEDLPHCFRLDRHLYFSVLGYLIRLGHTSLPPNSLSVSPPPAPQPCPVPVSPSPPHPSLHANCILTNMMD